MKLSLRSAGPLAGEISLGGDKSLSHRAALFAALAGGESAIGGFLVSGVTRAMLDALSALGVKWRLDGARLAVEGIGFCPGAAREWPRAAGASPPRIDCRNSATTIRMLAGALAACGVPATLDGSDGLRRRPMGRIAEPLARMGCAIESRGGCAPLILPARRGPLHAIHYALPVASAQVKSCLILAALGADGESVFTEPGPSRDHTERMLRAMGAGISAPAPLEVRVSPLARPLAPLRCELPGDISSAAFLMVAALLAPGSELLLRRVGTNPTRTGIVDALRRMGGDISFQGEREICGEPTADIRIASRPGAKLRAISVGGDEVVRMIDEIPALAVAAAFAEGVTEVRDAKELRCKETDRIAALCRELRRLGAEAVERPDGFSLRGGTLRGGECDAGGDHRLAMSLALAGLASPEPVTVQNAEILGESFPEFPSVLRSLGADARESGA